MSKRTVFASVATMLAVGGMAYGLSSFTSRSETCPLEGTPACPKAMSAQAVASTHAKTVADAELPPCCRAKKGI
ncbi:MAG: hypothetical protein J0I82_32285 [Spirosoma sp.]|uniref:hypothetical protein n=1 Tax=unclassified Spirosoma TaxID=2621999 RepID=UPI000AE29878|nr:MULTISPECIES: hypothetical protein [unclassified Spirosoma]MBN8826746.1 hypothetical protein [Spirosoma sp.]MCX6213691.1 hypothetical protein [Spirosoma sp.]